MTEPSPYRADEFRWQSFFQRSRDPLFVLNRQRRLLFANRAWEALTGLAFGQVRGLACTRRAPAAPSATDDVTRALAPPPEVLQGQGVRVRRCLPHGRAARRCWDIDFLPFHDDKGTLGILGKITPVGAEERLGPGALPEKLVALRASVAQRYTLESLAGETAAQRRLVDQVRLASQSRAAVLLVGEPGTGKQWLARTIHYQSAARELAFAALDCERLPPAALASALFGDGGLLRHPGVGTLYLREPARLPRDLQARLCEALAEPVATAPRLLAGSATDPNGEVLTGRLLEELYGSISTLILVLPPLRERLADLPRLAEHLLGRLPPDDGRRLPTLTPAAWDCLRAYAWPGNLSELAAVLAGARRHATGDQIDVGDLPSYLRVAVQMAPATTAEPERVLPMDKVLEQVERRLIQLALRRAGGNQTRAAEMLAIWRPRLFRRIKALGIEE